MDYTNRLAISYYKPIADLNREHHIQLVQHIETGKICVKKSLGIYNFDIYNHLHHTKFKGIPAILELCEDEGRLIVIEDYISGKSLSELIEAGTLNPAVIAEYSMELCSILEQFHAVMPPIVHRDIKPSNIIISESGHPVLLDFNAAKFTTDEESPDTVLLGTKGYAAPEQYGFGSSTPQTDIYALGILIREMLNSCGCRNEMLEKVVRKCTQMDPSSRYSDVHELSAALKNCRDSMDSRMGYDHTSWIPPGFRTRHPLKMFFATACYMFMTWFWMTCNFTNVTVGGLWLERIMLTICSYGNIFILFNYRNVQALFPFTKSSKVYVRIFGIVFAMMIWTLALLMLLLTIVMLFFSN